MNILTHVHSRRLFECHVHTDVESPLDRVVESLSGELRIPEFELAPAQEVVALEVDAEIVDGCKAL